MDNKYLFILTHSNQIDWYTVFATGFKESGSNYKTVIFVHGEEDADRARKYDCYDVVINILDNMVIKKDKGQPESKVSNRIIALENNLGSSFFWEDIKTDRWTRVASTELVVQYMNHAVDVLTDAYRKYEPVAAFGEYTMSIYRYAYRLFAADNKVMLSPITTRYYNRLYFETDLDWKWNSCISQYYDYLQNNIPSNILEKVSPLYIKICEERTAKPNYTIHENKSLTGYTLLSELSFTDSVRKMVRIIVGKKRSNNNNVRDVFLERNIFRSLLRITGERFNHYWYKKLANNVIHEKTRYATYFLHYQPEYTSDALGKFYQDQRRLIAIIAASLPADMMLVVKEHPTMIGLRKPSYYKEILSANNVLMVSHIIDSLKLISEGEIVFTIVGTPALEAMFIGKPAIIFGEYAFSNTNTISLCKDVTQLKDMIRERLSTKYDAKDVKEHSLALLAAKYITSRPGQIPVAEELISTFLNDAMEFQTVKNSFKDELKSQGLVL